MAGRNAPQNDVPLTAQHPFFARRNGAGATARLVVLLDINTGGDKSCANKRGRSAGWELKSYMLPSIFSAQEDLGYALVVVAALGVLHGLSVAAWVTSTTGPAGALGNRAAVPPETGWAGRARRALNNYLENIVVFIALVLAWLVFEGRGDAQAFGFGALVFALARAFYLPIYLIGVPVARTLAWLVSVGGLGVMAFAVLR